MEIRFLGATHEVTGSCTMITVNGRYLLVDYGMEQGKDIFVNEDLPVRPSEIDAVVLTHAHIDHSGLLPLLAKRGFAGQIYATEATANLCHIMLLDSAHIQEFEAEWKNRKGQRSGDGHVEPMYITEDAEAAIRRLVPYPYNQRVTILEGVDIIFRDAGHLLGSASIEMWLTEGEITKKIVFSGDLGNRDKPILCDPVYITEADYVVTESTYGDRFHEKAPANEDFVHQLAGHLQRTFDRGGNVVIPSFAVGRTQELLFFIREIKERGLVRGHDGFRVFVDSPLANEATSIFVQTDPSYFDEDMQAVLASGKNPLFFPGLEVAITAEESKAINFNSEPKVILSASGMCEAGRIRHHLKHNLWRKECLILFAGYQAEGTLGRVIFEGAREVKLFGEEIQVNAEIAYLANISGHADKAGLLRWIMAFEKKPDIVFVNHGEDSVCQGYAACLEEEYGFPFAIAPYSGTVFDLATGKCLIMKEGVPVPEKTAPGTKAAGFYAALVAAGKKIAALIAGFQGRPNKEVKRLTRDLEAVLEKWED